MALYQYRGRDAQGNLVTGNAEAENLQLLKLALREREIWLVQGQKYYPWQMKLAFHPDPTIKFNELLLFAKQMGVMLSSGITLVTALNQVMTSASARFKPVVAKIVEEVKNGKSYAEALAGFPLIFSPFFVGMIEVGETGGLLGSMHRKIHMHLQQSANLKKKLQFASIYPLFIFGATVVGVAMILIHAFPKIADIYNRQHVALPLLTRIMLALSGFLVHYWPGLLAVGVVLVWLGFGWRLHQKPPLKRWLDRWIFKIPVFNEFITRIILARLTLNLSLLLNAGVPILRALEMVKHLLGNAVVQNYLDELIQAVEAGEGMAAYLQSNRFFPPILGSLVQTGETSGELIRMMEDASTYFGEEVEDGMKKFVAVIEPLLIVMAASVVFLVLLAFYLPMFRMFKLLAPGG